jgi:hypothetical protein
MIFHSASDLKTKQQIWVLREENQEVKCYDTVTLAGMYAREYHKDVKPIHWDT